MRKNQKGVVILPILIIILLLGVVGYFTYQNYQLKQQRNPINITPTPIQVSPVPTKDPTTAWKTYTHSTAGFSFKYPTNLSPSECKNGLHLFETSLNLTSAEYCESPPYGKMSIDYGPGFSPGLLPPDYEVESSEAVVNGVPANKSIHRQVVPGPGQEYTQFIGLNGDKNTYLLTLRDENLEPVFNQILSTFELIE